MLRRFVLCLSLSLALAGTAAAQTAPPAAMTQDEFREIMGLLFGALNAGGAQDEVEAQARALRRPVVEAFGEGSRQVLELDMVITSAVLWQERFDEAMQMADTLVQRAVAQLGGQDTLAYEIAGVYLQALTQRGRADAAVAFGAQVILEAEEHLPADHMQITRLRLAVAQSAVEAGLLDEAGRLFAAVVAATEAAVDPEVVVLRAGALAEWGLMRQESQGGTAGEAEILRALADFETVLAGVKDADVRPNILTLKVAAAQARFFAGDSAAAEAILTPLLARAAAVWGEDSLLWAQVAQQWALVHGDTFEDPARAATALDHLGRVVAIRADRLSPLNSSLVESRNLYGGLLANQGRVAEALVVFQATLDTGWQPQRDLYIYTLARAQLDGVLPEPEVIALALRFLQASQAGAAARAQAELTARLEAGPQGALLRARSDAQRAADRARVALVAATSRPAGERDAGEETVLRAEVERWVGALAQAERSLAEQAPTLASATGRSPMTLAEVQAALAPDEALVVLDTSAGEIGQNVGLVVTADGADWYSIDRDTSAIAADVALLRDAVQGRLGVRTAEALAPVADPGAFPVEVAERLYADLMARTEPLLAGKAHVWFDLRGPVAALPPQMLLTGPADPGDLAGAPWLVRRHAVSLLPAISALRVAALARQRAAPRSVLAFADPVYDGAAAPAVLRSALAPLPETADEARAVAASLGAGPEATLTGAAASEAAVKAAGLDQFRVLYFATHGLVAGDLAGGGGAPLAEPALALTAGQGEDGFLTASEVAALSLNADWVVLSACNTAVGSDPDAEALSGLAQAFLYAGARSLLVSHWPVESKSAVALMSDTFARRAADPTLRAAEAQRQAALALMQRDGWAHPAYWAPFVLVGSPD
jgi:CHAT domain-containing protein